ncbi:ERF family protein [Reyranella massiliensis]|uniref:ERF family protein n=1 Tax=Reyranella massiliensis TaxID=445220 RepID=UPI0002E39FAF|nr:ERF family protein [Reyranella massiliensis]
MPSFSNAFCGPSQEIAKLAAALCKAQSVIEGAKKDSNNPHFKTKYADLSSVWEAVRKPLTDNGLSIVQFPRTVNNGVEIETTLLHTSGEYMSDVLWMPCTQMNAHGVGSAITYGRRYALMAVAGVAPEEDDDGNGAAGRNGGDEPHKPGVGSANAGTDFRPARRGSMMTAATDSIKDARRDIEAQNGPRRNTGSNWVDEARNDGTLDETREKGALPGKPAAPGKKSAAEKAKTWTDNAIQTIRLPGQHVGSLDKWWKEQQVVPAGAKFSPLGWLEEAAPEEYERLQAAFDEVRSNAQQVAA